MKELLEQIEGTQKLPGWASLLKAQRLAAMVIALQPDITIEAGIFGGRSFLPLALAHKYIGKGIAIGIEPWSKEAASEGYDGENKTWWSGIDIHKIQIQFIHHLNLLDLKQYVKIVQIKFQDYEIPDGVGLLHLDNQHTEQAIKDVKRIAPKMITGGLIVLDDLGWINEGGCPVESAALWLDTHGFIRLYHIFNKPDGVDDWGVWQKKK